MAAGHGQAMAVDGFQDFVAAARQQSRAGIVAEFDRVVTVAGIAEKFGAVWVGHNGFKM
jgi:hypothetical protein